MGAFLMYTSTILLHAKSRENLGQAVKAEVAWTVFSEYFL